MDTLKQTKLSREEWKSIESPVSFQEKKIMMLIKDAYRNIDLKTNDTLTMITFSKMENTQEIHSYLYQTFLKPEILKLVEKYKKTLPILETFEIKDNSLKKMKSVDMLRMKNVESNILENRSKMFEFTVLDLCQQLIRAIYKGTSSDLYLYTLIQLKKNHILHINPSFLSFWNFVVHLGTEYTPLDSVLKNAEIYIEKNKYLLQYEDLQLFPHQKELYSFCERNYGVPKLILYIAPTGTGKTLSPIGLSERYRILFVCVARHVGLALAKSAISMDKKVAFAFGCETASDIRLHYYSAIDYTINKRSGGIGKVDNSNGTNVEIMICDAQSYLIAMYYMMGFNSAENIITYWDEPTITMDYEEHEIHPILHRNWQENRIPNIILSCATLPKEEEIPETIMDFRGTFPGAEIHTITSYDCRKSIPILNKEGCCVLPHTLFSNIDDLVSCVHFCENNKTLLRYFDVSEIVVFIEFVLVFLPEYIALSNYFRDISEITMSSLKLYYLEVLKTCIKSVPDKWGFIYESILNRKKRKFDLLDSSLCKGKGMEKGTGMLKRTNSVFQAPQQETKGNTIYKSYSDGHSICSQKIANSNSISGTDGILLTTVDAYTLTDGPTIFLAEDVERIGLFFMKMSKIPEGMLQKITQTIIQNDSILKSIMALDAQVEKKLQVRDNSDTSQEGGGGKGREKKNWDSETEDLMQRINDLRKKIQLVNMNPEYIPNTIPHQKLWTPTKDIFPNAFMPNIGEETVREIMQLEIDRTFKILVLLGIGVLMKHKENKYEEIIKRLSNEQKLFIAIAGTDYVYGTNYQFCHGIIGKDLINMTPQKTLQSMGRIGRNNIQQEYTVRFRDDEMIRALFSTPERNMEAVVMQRLFCHD
jgi:hypothetical protein